MKKFALALIASVLVLFGFAAPAGAQTSPYGGSSVTATVSPASSRPGGPVTITVSACAANSPVIIVFNGATSTVTANAAGGATATVTAPSAAGTYPGTATCGTLVASFSVVVTAAVTPPGGLPATGSGGIDSTMTVALGLLAVGLGLFGVTMVRRRQTVTA